MKGLRSIGVLFVGVVLGSLASGVVSGQIPLIQRTTAVTANPRLVSSRVTLDKTNFAFFIRDTKVNACWLEIPGNAGEGIALAPAPVESCEVK